MDSRDLTPDQLRALTERLRPTLGYLYKFIERMTVLHYLGCAEVTGRRSH